MSFLTTNPSTQGREDLGCGLGKLSQSEDLGCLNMEESEKLPYTSAVVACRGPLHCSLPPTGSSSHSLLHQASLCLAPASPLYEAFFVSSLALLHSLSCPVVTQIRDLTLSVPCLLLGGVSHLCCALHRDGCSLATIHPA